MCMVLCHDCFSQLILVCFGNCNIFDVYEIFGYWFTVLCLFFCFWDERSKGFGSE